MESNRQANDGEFFFNPNHPLLNGIKQTGIRWGLFPNSNHPLFNGIKLAI